MKERFATRAGERGRPSRRQAKADHDFHEAETELKLNTELTRAIHAMTQEIHAMAQEVRQQLGGEDSPRGGS